MIQSCFSGWCSPKHTPNHIYYIEQYLLLQMSKALWEQWKKPPGNFYQLWRFPLLLSEFRILKLWPSATSHHLHHMLIWCSEFRKWPPQYLVQVFPRPQTRTQRTVPAPPPRIHFLKKAFGQPLAFFFFKVSIPPPSAVSSLRMMMATENLSLGMIWGRGGRMVS